MGIQDDKGTFGMALKKAGVFLCVANTVLLAVIFLWLAFTGQLALVQKYLTAWPGSEPFIITFLPVMLVVGVAWLWQWAQTKTWRKGIKK